MSSLIDISDRVPVYKQSGWTSNVSTDPFPYFLFTLCFSLLVFLFEIYLDIRQRGKFLRQRGEPLPPELIQANIPQDTVEKSIAYGLDKSSLGLVVAVVKIIESTLHLYLGFFPYVWDLSSRLMFSSGFVSMENSELYIEIMLTLGFFAISTFYDEITTLPQSLYGTFVIEQKHGFNKQTLALYFTDKLKTIGLTFIIGGPVLAILISIIRWGGQLFYFYVWGFLFLFSLIMMHAYPEYIAPLFNKYTRLESGEIFDAVKALARDVSFPLAKLFVVDGSTRSAHSNAYFYGFFKDKRIVLYDTLLKQVDQKELLAILGHEIGHWKLWHSIQGFVVTHAHTFAMLLAYSYAQHRMGLFTAFGFSWDNASKVPVFVSLFLFAQVFWSPVEKVLVFLMNCNSRHNEFQADRFASVNLGMGVELASGLVKITIENLGASTMLPDPLYSSYHFSHPPLVERLRAINSSNKDNASSSKKTE